MGIRITACSLFQATVQIVRLDCVPVQALCLNCTDFHKYSETLLSGWFNKDKMKGVVKRRQMLTRERWLELAGMYAEIFEAWRAYLASTCLSYSHDSPLP